jgi:hypothetical protein
MSQLKRMTRPHWASLKHPVTRYLWKITAFRGKRWLYVGAILLALAMIAGLLYVTYQMYRLGDLDHMLLDGERAGYVTLYPLLFLFQIAVTFGVMTQATNLHLTMPTTALDDRRRTWELAKATSHGAALVTQGRWFVLVGRMSGGLVVIMLARVAFAVLIVVDWAREPERFSAAVDAASPGVPDGLAALLIGLLLIGVLLEPITATLFSVAVGVLLTTTLYRVWLTGLIQRVLVMAAMLLVAGGLTTGWYAITSPREFAAVWPVDWLAVFGMVAMGDMGLRLLSRPVLLQMITVIDYGMWLGVPVLGVVIMQVLVTRWTLRWAVRLAARPERE